MTPSGSSVRLKSRSGCLQCKQRKVKCDEVRPTCRNCKRFGDTCRYQARPTASSSQSPQSSVSAVSQHGAVPSPTSLDLSASPANFSVPSSDSLAARRSDLELLHHFTAFTSPTLFDLAENCYVFQKYAPKLALDNDYLLHAIFALTALHLAHSSTGDDARQYNDLATSHNGQALAARPVDLSAALERDHEGVFAFSLLLAVYSFIFAWQTIRNDPTEDTIPVIVHWFNLTRGIESIIYTSGVADRILAGQFAVLFRGHDAGFSEDLPILPEVATQLEELRHFAQWHEHTSRNDELVGAYHDAIERLRAAHRLSLDPPSNHCRVSEALAWPVLLKQAFITALTERQPPAILVTIHYFLVLHNLKSYWWIGDGPSTMVKALAVMLPDDLQSWADWPLRLVGGL